MSTPKYSPGQKVRIVGHRVDRMAHTGKMDKWLGKVMTVSRVNTHQTDTYMAEAWYLMVEDQEHWAWFEDMIVGKAVSQDKLDRLIHKIVGEPTP